MAAVLALLRTVSYSLTSSMVEPLSHATVCLCPSLIGREVQIATLARLWEQTQARHGTVALISGEAGIGKSRLVAELKQRALAQACGVWQGNCFENDRTVPYAPLIDLLRAAVGISAPQALLTAFEPYPASLYKLIPEIAAPSQAPVASSTLEPHQEKRHLCQSLTRFLLATPTSAQQPGLIIVEDLHWADELSLEYLLYLARALRSHPCLLVLTYRDDELTPALLQFLVTVQRERLAHPINLPALEVPQVEAVIQAIFAHPQPVRPEFVERLQQLTDGNPFFIEEVLQTLVNAGDIFYADGSWTRKALNELRIPLTVQEAVARRTESLSPAARQLLTVAAVVGHRCTFALLQHVTQLPEATILELLKTLISAQLLREEAPDLFTFRHALARQAIYETLLGRERRIIHQNVLESLEAIGASATGELAYHAHAAGEWGKVMRYGQHAGEQALALFAPQVALDHFAQVQAAATHLHQPPATTHALHCGQAYALLSDFPRARQAYQQALTQARATADSTTEWQSLLALGTLAQEDDYQQAGDYFQAALTLARTCGGPTDLAHTLNWLGRWHSMMEEPEAAIRLQGEALAIFQARGDQPGLAATWSLLGWSHYVGADLAASVQAYRSAVAACHGSNEQTWLTFALAGLTMHGADYFNSLTYWPQISLSTQRQFSEQALHTAQTLGYRSGEARIAIWLGLGLGPRGAYQAAFEYAERALQIAVGDNQPRYVATAHILLGALYLDLLAVDSARQQLEQSVAIARTVNAPVILRVGVAFLAAAAIAQGDLDYAQTLLTEPGIVLDNLEHDAIGYKAQRLLWYRRAELALANDQPDVALAILDRLIARAAQSAPTSAERAQVIPQLWAGRGEALIKLERWRDAENTLLAAQRTAQQQHAQGLLWRIHASLARLYQRQRRGAAAQAARQAAQDLIDILADALHVEALRANFREQAQAQLPTLPPLTLLRSQKMAHAGLTAREREVTRLLAEGQTNREIAERLFISERTAAKHIENILGKLGFATRGQIIAWATTTGMD